MPNKRLFRKSLSPVVQEVNRRLMSDAPNVSLPPSNTKKAVKSVPTAASPPATKEESTMNTDINKILEERRKTHGDYTDHSRITQRLKAVIMDEDLGAADIGESSKLTPDQRETLDMIMHKVGRILAGDPNVVDHWDDIAGYAKLSADRVRERKGNV